MQQKSLSGLAAYAAIEMYFAPTVMSRIVSSTVARWFVFKPKLPIWVNFGGSCNGKCWAILRPFEKFYCHLVYFVVI
jgi:hypothetical protein